MARNLIEETKLRILKSRIFTREVIKDTTLEYMRKRENIRNKNWQFNRTSKMRIVKQCKCCGKQFIATRMSTLYCSRACNRRIVHEKERKRELSAKNALLEQEESNPDFNTSDSLKLLKASDLSVMLGVSHATVYRLFEKGTLKAVQIGHGTYVRQKDFDALFEANVSYKKRSYRRKCDTGNETYSVR